VKDRLTLVYVRDISAHHEEHEVHEGFAISDFFLFAFLPNCFLRDLHVLRGGYFSTGNPE
jgi:hypothetical protein